MQAHAKFQESIDKLIPGGDQTLAHLSDAEVLAHTRRLVGSSNRLFAALLLHLAEVEARGIHRTRACASLYTYCIYELRMSEDAAARRSSAARLVKAFPSLLDAIAAGELHSTGLLMLGPHLTLENHVEVLGRAKFRTKKEIAKLVRELNPLPRVADQMESLGPELLRPLRAPTWAELVESHSPPVRELPPGERPSAWANDTTSSIGEDHASVDANDGPLACADADHDFDAPARRELPPITMPQQYRMQFSTTEEHVRGVERAKSLLARTSPGISLGELHEQAMQLLVEKLEKEKFAVTKQSGRARTQAVQTDSVQTTQSRQKTQSWNGRPRQRGRHVPAAVKREVFTRDAGRCSYSDERGERCRETRYLELHHLHPFAQGGQHVATNLALRCRVHNALAAEQDFGRVVIERKRRSARHESLAAQATKAHDVVPIEPCAPATVTVAPKAIASASAPARYARARPASPHSTPRCRPRASALGAGTQ